MKKLNKGITLIALIITIIVLLILAGITIGMLTSNNSILNQSNNARKETLSSEEAEKVQLAVHDAVINSSQTASGELTTELVKNGIKGQFGDGEEDNVSGTGPWTYIGPKTKKKYKIAKNGEIKEKNPNELAADDLNENASEFFGLDVINYAETLPTELQYLGWQLFYAGDLEKGVEERIYLISKQCVKASDLPTVKKNGIEVTDAKPIAVNGTNEFAAKFANQSYSPTRGVYATGGIINEYQGSADITIPFLQRLNGLFYDRLSENNRVSTATNMKAVSYMMDQETWEDFKGIGAEYVIGAPTLELLYSAYNKYENKSDSEKFIATANTDGYANNREGPLQMTSMPTLSSDYKLWIASPGINPGNASGDYDEIYPGVVVWNKIGVPVYEIDGDIVSNSACFRPIVILNTDYTLEKTKDSNDRDAFKIVHASD